MQKPACISKLAFVFLAGCIFTSCETYDPKAKASSQKEPAQQVEYKPPVQQQEISQNEPGVKKLEPGLPTIKPGELLVRHFAYTLAYNEEHELASWVAYNLQYTHLLGKEKRSDDFRPDPAVKTKSADPDDYKLSGYDRGHLVPAGDMKWSKKAMSESFLMSNIAPQTHAFNAGIWETLESLVRSCVKKDSQLYIVTGPVLHGNLQIIGKNKVTVPEYFYKAILDVQEPEIKCIAFIIPMKAGKQPIMNFAVSVDSLEALINTDLFSGLPDSLENNIEKTYNRNSWKQALKQTRRKKRN